MRKIFAFIIAAALLATPALAADEPSSSSGDPAVCPHHFEVSVLREATCTEKGLLAYTCVKCGLTYTAETLADGEHDYEMTETTATCTQDGETTYTCARCGDTYTEAVKAAGHVPEDAPATCVHSQVCSLCGQVLTPATGHDYAYQYDAERDENGDFITFGTWKCANCGKTLAATEGNALYYYSLPEAEAAMAELSPASATDMDGADPATATDMDEPAASRSEEASDTDTQASDAADAAREDKPAADPKTGLWIAISAAALTAIVVEAVILVRSLRRKKDER